jgi:hypothetical protein
MNSPLTLTQIDGWDDVQGHRVDVNALQAKLLSKVYS